MTQKYSTKDSVYLTSDYSTHLNSKQVQLQQDRSLFGYESRRSQILWCVWDSSLHSKKFQVQKTIWKLRSTVQNFPAWPTF